MAKKNDNYDMVENYDKSHTDEQIELLELLVNGMYWKLKRAKELGLPMKTVEERRAAIKILDAEKAADDVLFEQFKKNEDIALDANFMVFSGELDSFLIDVIPVNEKAVLKSAYDKYAYNYNSHLELSEFDIFIKIQIEMDYNEAYLFDEKLKSNLTQCTALSTNVREILCSSRDDKAVFDDYLDLVADFEQQYLNYCKKEAIFLAKNGDAEGYFDNYYVGRQLLGDLDNVIKHQSDASFKKKESNAQSLDQDYFDLLPMNDIRRADRLMERYRVITSDVRLFKYYFERKLPKMSLDQMLRNYVKTEFGLLEKANMIVIQCQISAVEAVYLHYPFFKIEDKNPNSHKIWIHEINTTVKWVFFKSYGIHNIYPICYIYRVKGTYYERPRVRDFKKWVDVDLSVCLVWESFYYKWVRILYKYGFLFLEENTYFLRIVPVKKLHLVLNIYKLAFNPELIMQHSEYVTVGQWEIIARYMRLLNRAFLTKWDREKEFYVAEHLKKPVNLKKLVKQIELKEDDF